MTIRGLIEAIERGADDVRFGVLGNHEFSAAMAYAGSLDAAKALHDALLPGWWWAVGTCKVSDDARVSPDDDSRAPDGGEWADYTDIDRRPPGNPARAWLLSILIAVEGQAILRALEGGK
jgi:hypothetical protein